MKPAKVYAVPRVFIALAEMALETFPRLKSPKDRRTVALALATIRRVKHRATIPAPRSSGSNRARRQRSR
jgi:hypothetical protein